MSMDDGKRFGQGDEAGQATGRQLYDELVGKLRTDGQAAFAATPEQLLELMFNPGDIPTRLTVADGFRARIDATDPELQTLILTGSVSGMGATVEFNGFEIGNAFGENALGDRVLRLRSIAHNRRISGTGIAKEGAIDEALRDPSAGLERGLKKLLGVTVGVSSSIKAGRVHVSASTRPAAR